MVDINQNAFDLAIDALRVRSLNPAIEDNTSARSLVADDLSLDTPVKEDTFIEAVIVLISFIKTNITDINEAAGIKWWNIGKWHLTLKMFGQIVNLVINIVNTLVK